MQRRPAAARVGADRETGITPQSSADTGAVAEDDGGRDPVVCDCGCLGEDAGGATHVAADARFAERVDQLVELERARFDSLFQSRPAGESTLARDRELGG